MRTRARCGGSRGAGVAVMVDGTQSWDYPTAARLGPALQAAGVTWLETRFTTTTSQGWPRLQSASISP